MSKADLRVDWATHEAAKYACENWHYSKCVPNQKTVKVGVWESNIFVGVVIFGDGANAGMVRPYGISSIHGCELVRVALRDHKTEVTRIIRLALLFLRKSCPYLRLVVSYADPEQGHVGGIYQGGGWIYAGMTDPADEYLVNGKRMHGRALRSTRSSHKLKNLPAENIMDWAKKVLDPKIKKISGSSKHRYLMPLDVEMHERILPLSKPYPKRTKRQEPENPSGLGGSTPTRALHLTASEAGDGSDQEHGGGATPTRTLQT